MNKVILMGRLTKDPAVRYPESPDGTTIARYTLAVDRRWSQQQEADFISCVAFGKSAEFAEKYLHKGIKIAVTGRIQTGKYTNRDGQTVYTTDVVIEDQEFAESKSRAEETGNQRQDTGSGSTQQGGSQAQGNHQRQQVPDEGGFINIPEGLDEELPFK